MMNGDGIELKPRWGAFFATIPYYVWVAFVPYKLGFFHECGENKGWFERKRQIIGAILVVVGVGMMAIVDWKMAIWWFGSVVIFSQVVSFGQFWSERYTYLANVAWAVVVAKMLAGHDVILAVYCTVLACISWGYVPAYRDNGNLFSHGIRCFPKQKANYINLSMWYFKKKMWRDSIKPLVCALHLADGEKRGIYINLANAYANEGEWETALGYTDLALQQCLPKDREKLLEQRAKINNEIVSKRKKR
jgi:hypothetical protein